MFDSSFALLFRAVERIGMQLEHADEDLRQFLSEELNSLYRMTSQYFDHWMALDERIRALAEAFALDIDADRGVEESDMVLTLDQAPASTESRTSLEIPWPSENIEPALLGGIAFDLSDRAALSLRRGMAFYELLMFREASESLEEAVTEIDQPATRLYLAASYAALGQYERALIQLSLVRHTAKNAKILAACAEVEAHVHIACSRVESAIRQFLDITGTLPDYVDAWFNLGLCYLAAGDPLAAERSFLQAHRRGPDDCETLEWLATAQLMLGQPEKAIQTCQRVLAADSRRHRALVLFSAACREIGSHQAGLHASERMLSADPLHPAGYLHNAWYHLQAGDHGVARARLKQLLTLHRNDPQGLIQLGITAWLQGDLEQAERALLTAVSRTRDKSLVWIALGRISAQRADLRQAERRFLRALRDRRRSVRRLALYSFGLCLCDAGQFASALRTLQSAQVIGESNQAIAAAIARCVTHLQAQADRTQDVASDEPVNPSPDSAT